MENINELNKINNNNNNDTFIFSSINLKKDILKYFNQILIFEQHLNKYPLLQGFYDENHINSLSTT